MARFKYIGPHPPRQDGTYAFRVRSKGFEVTFGPNEEFEIPDSETFVLKCIRGHIDFSTQQKDYQEIV